MGENDKGKALFTEDDHSSENDWLKVVLRVEIIEEVKAKYGEQIKTKYSGHENVSDELTEEILEWVRIKTYNEMPEDFPSKL